LNKAKKTLKRSVGISNSQQNKKTFRLVLIGLFFCILIFLFAILYNLSINKTHISDNSEYDLIRKAKERFQTDPLVEKEIEGIAHLPLKPLLKITNYEVTLFLVKFIFLACVLSFLYLSFSKKYILFFILALSPFFIGLFTKYSEQTVLALLISLMVYGLIKKRTILSVLVQIGICAIDFYVGLFILFTALLLMVKKKMKIAIVAALSLPLFIFFKNSAENAEGSILSENINILEKIFVELGALEGIALVSFVIAGIAIYFFWKNNSLVHFLVAGGVMISFFNLKSGLLILNILVVYLAVIMIEKLVDEKWEIHLLKKISLFLIFCSILFSGTSYISILSEKPASPEAIDAMIWLGENADDQETILSYYLYGMEIKFFSKMPVLLDSDLNKIDRAEEKYQDTSHIFDSRNMKNTASLLDKYQIRYIFITEEMKQGLVWNKDEEGLIFIMENNEEFIKIFENEKATIYRYYPSLRKVTS
jgi:hypothetical protein